jgi:hypothetical protein
MSSRYSKSRKSNSAGRYNKLFAISTRRNASSATGNSSSATGNSSSATGSKSRRSYSRRSYSRMPSSITLNNHMGQLALKMTEIDEKVSTQRKEKRNVARPYFEIYNIIRNTLPTLPISLIDDIRNKYLTRESKQTPYYTMLQYIVNRQRHTRITSFMEDEILLDNLKELCNGVPPSWKIQSILNDPEIKEVKNLQDNIDSLCRLKLGKRVGGSKSRKKQKRQKKRTKRKYYKKKCI